METRITVLGAGMVGVSCALELQRRGAQVTLLDRREPGHETSWGNAGVIARSSLLPFNHPGLWRSLPQHLRNRGVHLRYDPRYLAAHPRRFLRYLWNARSGPCLRTATALDGLIRLSSDLHPRWLEAAGESARLRRDGWLFLYRSEQAFAAGAAARALYAHFGVDTEMLDAEGLAALEPAVQPVFARALWIRDAMSVDDPGAVVSAYARLFATAGGRIERGEVRRIEAVATEAAPAGWRLHLADGGTHDAPCVVVALGSWSASMLQPLGLRVPMIHERGYHRHYAAVPGSGLTRPVCDVQGGYVLSPMARGLRLSSGVELAPPQSPAQPAQLELAERNARAVFPLGEALEEAPWMGARPTLPDCRPMIGAVPGRPGLWLAFGHQHIGFSTGPGSARLLGALMAGEPPPLDPALFAPARFLH